MMHAVPHKSAEENARKDIDKLIEKLQKCKTFDKYDRNNIDAAIDVLKNYLPPHCPSTVRNFKDILIDKYEFDRYDLEDNFYKMSSTPLGYCLIINNIVFDDIYNFKERKGSEVDEKKFQAFFEKAGFEVKVERNLTADEMKNYVETFSQMDFTEVDSMILIIMSHGGQEKNNEVVYGRDGEYLSKYDIYSRFNNRNESLQLKPKVFFFIACRGNYRSSGVAKGRKENSDDKNDNVDEKENGDSKEHGILNDGKESEDDEEFGVLKSGKESVDDDIPDTCSSIATVETLTELSDIFIINSTLLYNVTVRNHEKGTYFCQFFIPVLNEYYLVEDLEAMIKRVNRQMVGKVTKQDRLTQAVPYESHVCLKYLWFCRKS